MSKSTLLSTSEDDEVAASPPPQPDTTTDDSLDLMGDLTVTTPNSTSLVPTIMQQPESFTCDSVNLLDATATPQLHHASNISNVQSNYDLFASGQFTNATLPLSTAQNDVPLAQHDPFATPNDNNFHVHSESSTIQDLFAPQQPLFIHFVPLPVAPSILHCVPTAGATPTQPIADQPTLNSGLCCASSLSSQP